MGSILSSCSLCRWALGLMPSLSRPDEFTVRRWPVAQPEHPSNLPLTWVWASEFPTQCADFRWIIFSSSVRWRVWAALLARNQRRQSGSSARESPRGQDSGESNQKETPCTSQGPTGGGGLFEENPTERWLMEVSFWDCSELVPPRPTWLDRLVEPGSPGSSERPCSVNNVECTLGKTLKNNLYSLHVCAHMWMGMPTHIHPHRCKLTYAHTTYTFVCTCKIGKFGNFGWVMVSYLWHEVSQCPSPRWVLC